MSSYLFMFIQIFSLFVCCKYGIPFHFTPVNSFVSLGKELLLEECVEYLLTARLNQDPLEQYFSRQRAMGGDNENPDASMFGYNQLRVITAGASAVRAAARGNVTVTPEKSISISNMPLPRRPQARSKKSNEIN